VTVATLEEMPVPTSPRRTTILLVDDNEANRYAVGRMLREVGFAVAEAGTGREAVRRAEEHPDLVVLDVNLPDINGFEVLRQIRANPATASLPVLHLSASFTKGEHKAFGLEQGADGYLTHPVEPPVLIATVRALIRIRQAEETMRASAALWQATFDAIGDSVFLLDESACVLRCNRAAASLLRLPEREVVGRTFAEAIEHGLGATLELPVPLPDDAARSGAEQLPPQEVCIRDSWFRVAVDPVLSEHGERVGAVYVLTDITERKRAERERAMLLADAEAARAEAEAANRAKMQFLTAMSHELRTPLNAIGGYVQLLEMGLRGPVTAQQQQDLDRIQRSQRHLLSLVNDVLNFARVESGTVHYSITDVPVDETLSSIETFIAPQAAAKGLRYEYRACPRPLVARADRDKLQQIVLNLVGNAVKFTAAGGLVTVACEPTARGERLAIVVRDTGPGIPPDKLQAVFEPFVQVDRSLTSSAQGAGLGLAISRDLARGMGGDLSVESTLGKGASFTLTLPLA
jgi:PAS domain S-box-containing protein